MEALCGATTSSVSSTTCLTDRTSVTAAATVITPTTSDSASTLSMSLIKSATMTTRAPSFSGAITFSTFERPAGGSGLPDMLPLDDSPVLTGPFYTPDPSVTQIIYNPNSMATTESSRTATTCTTPDRGSGNGTPFAIGSTNFALSSSINFQRSA
ncbi:hypothetical protein B9Z19DRAFT_1124600 [Tuber borchii]|uniref:Uncharacterized protein n=1 Tax=Tuber borchii TaxID=42251 RepID=A0A2T6ZWE0_TUBBO|nr:hypothetical protein B9Z19DRAFT_1124600 [Tuber borchii]